MKTGNCPKCAGTGWIDAFSNIANGRCFTCGGSGQVFGAHKGTIVSDPYADDNEPKGKTIELDGRTAYVHLHGRKLYAVDVDKWNSDSEADCGTIWIDRKSAQAGRIVIEEISDGLLRLGRGWAQKALESALRV